MRGHDKGNHAQQYTHGGKGVKAMTEKEYVQAKGTRCLYCGSGNIGDTDRQDFDGDHATNEIQCFTCGKLWLDFYQLVGVVTYHDGETGNDNDKQGT